MATYADVEIEQGADFKVVVAIDEFAAAGLSLTDYTLRGGLKRSFDAENLISFAIEFDETSPYEFKFSLDANETSLLKAVRYPYTIELSDETGATTRLVEGYAEVTPSVYHSAPPVNDTIVLNSLLFQGFEVNYDGFTLTYDS